VTAFSDWLRDECADAWRAAHEDHPFVLAIRDGDLPLEKFQYFMRQDYLFLADYCRVVALAAAKSLDLDSMGRWASLLDETLNSEMALHRSFCADFGISESELADTTLMPATAAYTDHLLRSAYHDDALSIAVGVLPCQWGYDGIGRMLERELSAAPDSFHARWAAGYAAPEYREMTAWLKSFVDVAGAAASQARRGELLDLFRAGVRYEYLFWEAAWNLQTWPD
jgi:thiaminase/transcriptional activator TenA